MLVTFPAALIKYSSEGRLVEKRVVFVDSWGFSPQAGEIAASKDEAAFFFFTASTVMVQRQTTAGDQFASSCLFSPGPQFMQQKTLTAKMRRPPQ